MTKILILVVDYSLNRVIFLYKVTIKLFNSINVKQKTFDRHSKFRFFKIFLMNLLINLIVIERIVFIKTNSIIVKTTLILFVKITSMNFYELKLYKKVIIDVQYKIN